MTNQEKTIYNFCGKHADWWPSTSQVKEMVVLLQKDWKGLTMEEIEDVGFNLLPSVSQKDFVAFARILESNLKEKNDIQRMA